MPFARPGLALMRKFRGNFFVNSYVKAKFLSHDPERVASYDNDPLITKAISVNVLLGLYEAADRVVADAQAILAASAAYAPDRHIIWGVIAPDEAGEQRVIAYTGNGPTSEANARFLASAPDMVRWLVDIAERAARFERLWREGSGQDADCCAAADALLCALVGEVAR